MINLTCTACLSIHGVEAVRFFFEGNNIILSFLKLMHIGGTKNEVYAEYFEMLLEKMHEKYP